MKLKEFDILLDIKRHKNIEYFEIVQGDYESNILKISLVEDLNEYVLSGLKVEIAFAKSDGTTVLQDLDNGISLLGNKIICTLKTNTIASPGKVLAEVRILEGIKLLTSSRFSFFVRQAIVNDKTIESTNEFPILEQLTNSVTGIIASEESRVINEDIRLRNETDRVIAEEIRVSNEEIRVSSEGTRVSNEVNRVDSEAMRASNEVSRTSGEVVRESNEADRLESEALRKSAEVERIANEGIRKVNESDRIVDENNRVASEGIRVSNEEERKLAEQNREVTFKEYDTRITEVEIKSNKNTDDIIELEQDLTQHKEEYTNQRQQDQLKVATVEKELNDYKGTMASVNVNQEAKQKISGYGIISLPKTAANGQVNISLKGRTLFNHVNNGVDYTNWILQGTGTTKGINGIHLVNNATPYDFARLTTNLQPSKEYTLIINIKAKTGAAVLVQDLSSVFGATLVMPSNSGVNKIKFTTPATITSNRLNFYVNGNEGDYIDFEVYAVLEGDFINDNSVNCPMRYGSKSTISASRLKSVGKNLNSGMELGGLVWTTGLLHSVTDRIRSNDFIEVFPGTTIITNTVPGGVINIFEYNSAKKFIKYTKSNSITATGHTHYVKFLLENVTNPHTLFQIEQNTVTTQYEPYTESTQYLPNVGELRSLSNGAKDEVRVSGNKAELVKRNDKKVIEANDITSINDTGTVTLVYMKKPVNYKGYSGYSPNDYAMESFIASGYSAVTSNVGRISGDASAVSFVVSLPTGTSLTQAGQQLAGLELTYQLAEPIITPIKVNGTLLSNPSGTIYVENIVADAGIYTTKFDIKDTQLPIKSIDKLIKYNFATGVQSILDTSLAVINADKKSFTHPKLAKNDMVFVDYYYDVESTLGETTIEYYDSRHTIKDSVNNKFYKWDIKSSNGVPTVVLTEVL